MRVGTMRRDEASRRHASPRAALRGARGGHSQRAQLGRRRLRSWPTATSRSAAGSWPARWPTGSSSGCCPFALVLVGGIGIAADVSSESPASAARSLGLQGVVSNSVAQASQGSSRWYALLIGIPILVWASRGLLKALIVVHRLIWGDVRREVPKPTFGATFRILLLMGVYFAIREGERGRRVRGRAATR